MGRSNNRRWLRWLAEGLIFLAVFTAVSYYQSRDLIEGEVPPLVGTAIDGEQMDIRRWRGEPVLVHFWATWCPVCAMEQGSIDALARDYPVLTVAMQSGDARTITRYLEEEGVNYPVLPDPEGNLARRYGVAAVPATFVLNGAGEVRFATVGYTTEWGMRLRLWWAGLW